MGNTAVKLDAENVDERTDRMDYLFSTLMKYFKQDRIYLDPQFVKRDLVLTWPFKRDIGMDGRIRLLKWNKNMKRMDGIIRF